MIPGREGDDLPAVIPEPGKRGKRRLIPVGHDQPVDGGADQPVAEHDPMIFGEFFVC